jgi:hypothetical protein
MNRKLSGLAAACLVSLALAGCVGAKVESTQAALDRKCAREDRLHNVYLTVIAPFRPADKVQKAKDFHGKVQKVCTDATTGTIAQRLASIAKLIDDAIAARNAR